MKGRRGKVAVFFCYHTMMKRVMLVVMVLWLHAETSACAETVEIAPGEVTKITRGVVVQRLGSGIRAEKNAKVHISDRLVTDGEGRAQLTLQDGASLDLAGNTAIRINQYVYDQKLNKRLAWIRLLKGTVRVVLYEDLGAGSQLYVETNHALIVPNRQAVVVLLSGDSETEVVVLRGNARVKSSKPYVIGEVTVNAGQRTAVGTAVIPRSPANLERAERIRITSMFEY